MDLGSRGHGRDGAAVGVSEHHEHRRAEMIHAIFGGPDFVRVGYVSGDLDHEQVSNPLIEKDFNRDPRIGTGDDRGEGGLSFRGGQQTSGKTGVGVGRLAQGEPQVSFGEHLQSIFGTYGMDARR